MSKRLFVGNIPHTLDEAGLTRAFEDVGVVVTNPKILRDRETGNPRGFGFVDIPDEQRTPETETIEVMGRLLRIEMAQTQNQDRPTVSRPRRPGPSQQPIAMAPEPRDQRGRKPERPGRGRDSRRRDAGGGW